MMMMMTMPGMKMIRDGFDHNVFHEFYCYNCRLLVSPREADNLAGNWICRRFREAATHRFGCIFLDFFQRVFVDHCRLKKLSGILFSAFFCVFLGEIRGIPRILGE